MIIAADEEIADTAVGKETAGTDMLEGVTALGEMEDLETTENMTEKIPKTEVVIDSAEKVMETTEIILMKEEEKDLDQEDSTKMTQNLGGRRKMMFGTQTAQNIT